MRDGVVDFVMRGLDPRIHDAAPFGKNDARYFARRVIIGGVGVRILSDHDFRPVGGRIGLSRAPSAVSVSPRRAPPMAGSTPRVIESEGFDVADFVTRAGRRPCAVAYAGGLGGIRAQEAARQPALARLRLPTGLPPAQRNRARARATLLAERPALLRARLAGLLPRALERRRLRPLLDTDADRLHVDLRLAASLALLVPSFAIVPCAPCGNSPLSYLCIVYLAHGCYRNRGLSLFENVSIFSIAASTAPNASGGHRFLQSIHKMK